MSMQTIFWKYDNSRQNLKVCIRSWRNSWISTKSLSFIISDRKKEILNLWNYKRNTMCVSNNKCKRICSIKNQNISHPSQIFLSLTFFNIHSLQLRETPKVVVYSMKIVSMHSPLASQVFTYIKVKCFLLSPKSVSEHVIY